MGYPQQFSHGTHLIPLVSSAANDTKPLAAIDLSASAGTHGEFLCVRPCLIRRIGVVLSVAIVATSTAPTVVCRKRPTPGSSSGDSALATLTLPDTTAIGKVVYKDITPVALDMGDSINITWTQAVGGSVAGKASIFFICEDSPEYVGNSGDAVASA